MKRPLQTAHGAARLALLVWGALAGFPANGTQAQSPSSGVVVEGVEPGSPGAAAGFRAGDTLVGWRIASDRPGDVTGGRAGRPTSGLLPDPSALDEVITESAPRDIVTVQIWREGVARDISLPARTSRWGLIVRPALDPVDHALWTRALDAPLSGALDLNEEAEAGIRAVVGRLSESGNERAAAWLRLRLVDRLVQRRALDSAGRELQGLLTLPIVSTDARLAGGIHGRISDLAQRQARWDEALSALARAIALEPPDARTLTRANWLNRRAGVQRTRGSYDDAAQSAAEALAIRRDLAPRSLDEAASLSEIATIALARRDLDRAWANYEAARQLAEAEDASGFEVARVDHNLALVDFRRGRISEADRRLQSAIAITGARAPESVDHARNLNLLGILRSQSGQLPEAAELFEQSLALHQRLDPGGSDEASVSNNLGILAMQRGRFAEAEHYYRRSLALKEQLGLSAIDRGLTISNLGLMSVERRDLESARAYLQRGLDLVRQVAGESPEAANALNNLARVERLAGNLAAAERLARDGLAMRARLAPTTVIHAFSFSELGKVLEAAGRLEESDEAHRQALGIREGLLPDGTNVADSLDALGRLAFRRGRLDEASDLHAKAGAIWRRMAPDGVYEAVNLVERGRVEVARGQSDPALDLYARATEILDAQIGSVGGSFETQADFRNGLAAYYAEYVDLLLRRDRVAEAFHVSERARTRAFLALLAERDLAFSSDVPKEIDARRRTLTREYERVQADLSALSATRDAGKIAERTGRLRDVRLELAAVNAEMAKVAPRLAGIRTAEPLDVDAAHRLLDADTAVVSYVIGERTSHAFVLTRSSLDVFDIPLGRRALTDSVQRLLRLVERPDDIRGLAPNSSSKPAEDLIALAREMYQAILAPADDVVGRHRRLLVVPDGPLHSLPFAALARQGGRGARGWQYLVEWRPVHQVPSLTVYGQLRTSGSTLGSRARLVAVGSPRYTASVDGGRADRTTSPEESPTALPPLPGSRREVEILSTMYGRQATALVDGDASEEHVRRRILDADIVHIAVHGLINERFPLDSALAFTTPATNDRGDNGLLQSWEILEDVRLRARLVVLSACDTAGAREVGGEGLLGLTRAFQFAGAPSVVASLWRVPDEITPTLMREFHRHIRSGQSIDDALANAQRAMIRDERTAHPYNWAAFVLNGRN